MMAQTVNQDVNSTNNTSIDVVKSWIINNLFNINLEWDSRRLKHDGSSVILNYYYPTSTFELKSVDNDNDNAVCFTVDGVAKWFVGTFPSIDLTGFNAIQNTELSISLIVDAFVQNYSANNTTDNETDTNPTGRQKSFATNIAKALNIENELAQTPLTKREYSNFISKHQAAFYASKPQKNKK